MLSFNPVALGPFVFSCEFGVSISPREFFCLNQSSSVGTHLLVCAICPLLRVDDGFTEFSLLYSLPLRPTLFCKSGFAFLLLSRLPPVYVFLVWPPEELSGH